MANMSLTQFHEAHEKEQNCKTKWYEGEAHDDSGKWEWYGARFGTYSIRAKRVETQSQQTIEQGKNIIAQAKQAQKSENHMSQKMKNPHINCMIEDNDGPRYHHNPLHGMVLETDTSESEDECNCTSYILKDDGWDDATLRQINPTLQRTNIRGTRYCRL